MIILVADTSVLIDLERGGLFEVALRGPDIIASPDFLFERELAQNIGPRLLELGMQVLVLDDAEMNTAQALHNGGHGLSLPDCSAYVGACRPNYELLAGDGALRRHANTTQVTCHGLLWLLDRLHDTGTATPAALHAALTTISGHRRGRLPPAEVQLRLRRWQW